MKHRLAPGGRCLLFSAVRDEVRLSFPVYGWEFRAHACLQLWALAMLVCFALPRHCASYQPLLRRIGLAELIDTSHAVQAHFDALFQQFARRCLRAARHAVEPPRNEAGLSGQTLDYEGGFIMIALEHEGSPVADWHRADLFG